MYFSNLLSSSYFGQAFFGPRCLGSHVVARFIYPFVVVLHRRQTYSRLPMPMPMEQALVIVSPSRGSPSGENSEPRFTVPRCLHASCYLPRLLPVCDHRVLTFHSFTALILTDSAQFRQAWPLTAIAFRAQSPFLPPATTHLLPGEVAKGRTEGIHTARATMRNSRPAQRRPLNMLRKHHAHRSRTKNHKSHLLPRLLSLALLHLVPPWIQQVSRDSMRLPNTRSTPHYSRPLLKT